MRRKLLLADDSITVQRVIELTFADEDLDVSTVGDGGQAIALIERDRPDIVFADLTMPVRDGYGVAEHVKRTPALAGQTRVVLLTGAFEPVDQERVGLLGVDGVLAKPFEPRVAIALVHELLAKPPQAAKPRDDRTAAAGYPFEPGAGGPRSTPAELDDYFQRLDEALASAGLVASSAVRDMLAESKTGRGGGAPDEKRGGKARDGAAAAGARTTDAAGAGEDGAGREKDEARPTASAADVARVAAADGVKPGASAAAAGAITAAPGTGGAAPGVAGALASLAEAVKEKKTQMSATPSVPASGTLVDAFSALLAEEQGEAAPADRGTGNSSSAGASPSSSSFAGALSQSAIDEASAGTALASGAGTGDRVETGAASGAGVGVGGVGLGGVDIVDADRANGAASGSDLTASDSSGFTSAPAAAGVSSATGVEAENTGRAAASGLVALGSAGSGSASATPALPALPMTDEFLDAVARRIVDQYGERILREVVTAQVVDIAERLVREEIERLKAAADRV